MKKRRDLKEEDGMEDIRGKRKLLRRFYIDYIKSACYWILYDDVVFFLVLCYITTNNVHFLCEQFSLILSFMPKT